MKKNEKRPGWMKSDFSPEKEKELLSAAAPELLAVCQAVFRESLSEPLNCSILSFMSLAIQKAINGIDPSEYDMEGFELSKF